MDRAELRICRWQELPEVEAEFFVYVRRLPTLEEQNNIAVWRDSQRAGQNTHVERSETEVQNVSGIANLIPVWTRERVRTSESLSHSWSFCTGAEVSRDLGPLVRSATLAISLDGAYSGRQPIAIQQTDLDSNERSERAVKLAQRLASSRLACND